MADTRYENIRESMSESVRLASDAQIEALLEARGLDADMAEGFLDDIGKMAPGIGKAVLKAAPSILPVAGTLLGGAFGGPIGASLGGSLGQLAGGAISSATGGGSAAAPASPAPPPPMVAPPAPPAVPSTMPPPSGISSIVGGVASASPGAAGAPAAPSAAGQLLQAVTRPETLRALVSMAMGPVGTVNVNVGTTPVPVAAFANMLGVLSTRAATEYGQARATPSPTAPAYMTDYAGELTGDPALLGNRADALYELLERDTGEGVFESAEAADAEAAEAAEAEAAEAESADAEAEAEAWELMEFIESFEGS
jgi:hypothetical protein